MIYTARWKPPLLLLPAVLTVWAGRDCVHALPCRRLADSSRNTSSDGRCAGERRRCRPGEARRRCVAWDSDSVRPSSSVCMCLLCY